VPSALQASGAVQIRSGRICQGKYGCQSWSIPFHLRQAFLPGWVIRACSSLSNPFTGVKIHRIFSLFRLTHSYGYESAADQPTLFAIFSLNFVPFM
jgi:hypothetical protein